MEPTPAPEWLSDPESPSHDLHLVQTAGYAHHEGKRELLASCMLKATSQRYKHMNFMWTGDYMQLLNMLVEYKVPMEVVDCVEHTYSTTDGIPGLPIFLNLGSLHFRFREKEYVTAVVPGNDWFYLGANSLEDLHDLREAYRGFKRNMRKCMMYEPQTGWSSKDELLAECDKLDMSRLVMDDVMREDLIQTINTPFSAEACTIYDQMGLPRKRGVILEGPPGNGKTSICKAAAAHLKSSLVYVSYSSLVQSPEFTNPGWTPQPYLDPRCPQVVQQAFSYAQELAPCLLVIEEIDGIITAGARSALLTAMDGLVPNKGVLTIATTNNIKILDDAIKNRPSRFDRVYKIRNPGARLRTTYFTKMIEQFMPAYADIKELATDIASETSGFSFAHLQEVILGFAQELPRQPEPTLAIQSSLKRVKASFGVEED